MIDKYLTENIPHDNDCSCGLEMCFAEEYYSKLYDEMVALYECPGCGRTEEIVL